MYILHLLLWILHFLYIFFMSLIFRYVPIYEKSHQLLQKNQYSLDFSESVLLPSKLYHIFEGLISELGVTSLTCTDS